MNKTLSLETAKLLVEKGVVLETEKYWREYTFTVGDKKFIHNMLCPSTITVCANIIEDKKYPAPDIPELLEALPKTFEGGCLAIENENDNWSAFYSMGEVFIEKELTEALAQLLIWVKQNNPECFKGRE